MNSSNFSFINISDSDIPRTIFGEVQEFGYTNQDLLEICDVLDMKLLGFAALQILYNLQFVVLKKKWLDAFYGDDYSPELLMFNIGMGLLLVMMLLLRHGLIKG